MKSIVEQVIEHSRKTPDKIALLDGKTRITYGELAREIFYSKSLLESEFNLKKGDSIIIAADKQTAFAGLYFACHLSGVVVLPVSPDTNERRYKLIKERVQPALVVGFRDGSSVCAELADFSGLSNSVNYDAITYPSLDEVADIMFTTGTTGEPKGVQLSHKNIMSAARNINTYIRNNYDDVEMIVLPVSHSFGIGRMRCALSNGQTVVMLGNFANVKRFFRFIEKYRVTGFGMVPASWALLKKLSGMKLGDYKDQLHYIEIGSAPMPVEEKKKLMEILPQTRICMHYGLTEASRSAFIEFHESERHLTTVGKSSPNMRIAIKDENGQNVLTGEEGEICVEGDAVTVDRKSVV